MRKTFLLGMMAACYLSASPAMAEEITLEPAPIEKAYFPEGYDDNDLVEIVLFGYLPNGCYKHGPLKVDVDHDAGEILIEAMMVHHHKPVCTEILVEYTETVHVGFLQAKSYKIVLTAHDNRNIPGKLEIAPSQTSETDDHVYLPVSGIELAKTATGQELVLTGTLPKQTGECIQPDTHKVYLNPKSVLVVQPIAKVVKCDGQDKQAFEYRIPLAGDLEVKKDMMVHVRALNGRSVNKVYDWVYYKN